MNKLRKKTYWTILVLLSSFALIVLFIFNYQIYTREKRNVEQNLLKMNLMDKNFRNKNGLPKLDDEDISNKQSNPRTFIDATIYTVLLDGEDEIVEIVSHTTNGAINENVAEIAQEIVRDNEDSKVYIGNLYVANYSYKYEKNDYIILIDNFETKGRLLSSLRMTFVLFALAEIVSVIISKILSDWIIKPVELSFDKQKQFVADASHELKTPLSVIIACAETLEENPKEQKWLDNIKSEANRMSKLITNLLDLAKIENETDKSNYENADLSKLVEMTILTFESLAYEKSIKLDYDIADDVCFECDKEEIKELLCIMLDNAIKHSFKEGKIAVNLKVEKGNIVLEVTNSGKPIPNGEEEKIFERFYRVSKSRNRNDNRYGLGLAIAKGIVTNHKGTIMAFSDDKYTTFRVIFKK